jgi:hypothetical protein
VYCSSASLARSLLMCYRQVSHDGFLFLPEPLYLLLNPHQLLLLCCSFAFLSFPILFLHLDLIELGISMDDLEWRRYPLG